MLVFSYLNNRAVVYLSDSLIYDSQTVTGEFNVEVDLTEFVEAGLTDLKIDVYNGELPYNSASPDWKIVYDIYFNEELIEFVSEAGGSSLGLVHTENHNLSDL